MGTIDFCGSDKNPKDDLSAICTIIPDVWRLQNDLSEIFHWDWMEQCYHGVSYKGHEVKPFTSKTFGVEVSCRTWDYGVHGKMETKSIESVRSMDTNWRTNRPKKNSDTSEEE
ncbi:hypothetical protein OESDEN_06727 [Oesophagostomum dentatum]|uniref:Uncharacterized protein n=1 Tax=Oesophagostomum dentatum TaxID=61180 RepID=A0A0B1TC04_OESDE|nr:hypothetical protein OESDEN_06727 [Oesophagostomum dentatum]